MEETNKRKRVSIELTLNRHTLQALGLLADFLGKSRSQVVDDAISALAVKHGFKATP